MVKPERVRYGANRVISKNSAESEMDGAKFWAVLQLESVF